MHFLSFSRRYPKDSTNNHFYTNLFICFLVIFMPGEGLDREKVDEYIGNDVGFRCQRWPACAHGDITYTYVYTIYTWVDKMYLSVSGWVGWRRTKCNISFSHPVVCPEGTIYGSYVRRSSCVRTNKSYGKYSRRSFQKRDTRLERGEMREPREKR